MKPIITRLEGEINKQLDLAYATKDSSKYNGMTYEQGILAMFDWLTGDTDEPPMEED